MVNCTCKQCAEKPPLWWLDFTAEKQVITKDGVAELFAETEAKAVRQFADGIQRQLEQSMQEVANQLSNSIRSGDTISVNELQAVQEKLRQASKKLIENLADTAKPYAQTIAEAGLNHGASLLPDGSFDMGLLSDRASQAVVEAAKRSAVRMANSVSSSFADSIASKIGIGIQDNLTGLEVADLLEESGLSADRAMMIARTESARAYTDGQNIAWDESGVVKGKKWLVSPNACEFCLAAQAEFGQNYIPLDQPFYERGAVLNVGGKTMALDFDATSGAPLHPNCRC
ncbi:hypothetical protein UFOVP1237_41, partial [uncultured Caudovirales phage]